jgi:hypothetical protein
LYQCAIDIGTYGKFVRVADRLGRGYSGAQGAETIARLVTNRGPVVVGMRNADVIYDHVTRYMLGRPRFGDSACCGADHDTEHCRHFELHFARRHLNRLT